jgi:hypothetical protein
MEKEQLINLLKSKDQSVEKVQEQSPYSQDDLSKYIGGLGFNIEQTPKLSELAKSLNPYTQVLDEKKEIKDEKNPISIVRNLLLNKSEKEPKEDRSDKQLSIEALQRLIANYKGE